MRTCRASSGSPLMCSRVDGSRKGLASRGTPATAGLNEPIVISSVILAVLTDTSNSSICTRRCADATARPRRGVSFYHVLRPLDLVCRSWHCRPNSLHTMFDVL